MHWTWLQRWPGGHCLWLWQPGTHSPWGPHFSQTCPLGQSWSALHAVEAGAGGPSSTMGTSGWREGGGGAGSAGGAGSLAGGDSGAGAGGGAGGGGSL